MLETPDCLSISPVNKKLNFEVMDDGENHELQELHQFDLELDSIDLSLDISEELMKDDKFSPCRTRSGVVYESGLKRRKILTNSRRRKKAYTSSARQRTRTSSGHSGTGSLADCSENDSDDHMSDHMMSDLAEAEERLSLPPPLNYLKEPVSRFSHRRHQAGDIPSSPISSFLPEDRLSPIKQTAVSNASCFPMPVVVDLHSTHGSDHRPRLGSPVVWVLRQLRHKSHRPPPLTGPPLIHQIMSILDPLNLPNTMLGKLTQLSARLEQCIR